VGWYVALGGAVGSVARYFVGTLIQGRGLATFPLGTLVVNVTGSLLLGILMGLPLSAGPAAKEIRAFLTTGICGGYTTFSTFSVETVRLIQEGDRPRAALYIGLSVALSLAAAGAGFALAQWSLAARRHS
jgi:CrcB protein